MLRKTVIVPISKINALTYGNKRKFQSMDISQPKKSNTLRLENNTNNTNNTNNNKRNSVNLNTKVEPNKNDKSNIHRTNPTVVQNIKSNQFQSSNSPLNSKNTSVNSCGIIYKSSLTQSNTYQTQLEEEINTRKKQIIDRLQRQKEMEKRLKDFTNHDKVKSIISRNDVKKEVPQSCNASFNGWSGNLEQKKMFLEQKLKEIENLTSTKPKNFTSSNSNQINNSNKITLTKLKVKNKLDKSERKLNSAKEKNNKEKDKKTKIKEAIHNNSYLVNQMKQGFDNKKDKDAKLNNEKDKEKEKEKEKEKKNDKKSTTLKNKQPFQGMKSKQV